MAFDVLVPQMGESVLEGTILEWKVKVGDKVKLNQPLVELMTDKVNVEIPAETEGVLTHQYAKEGEVVPVGTRIASIDDGTGDAEPAPSATEAAEPSHAAKPEKAEKATTGETPAPKDKPQPARPAPKATGDRGKGKMSPKVKMMVRQYDLDPSSITPTGKDGIVTVDDVERAIEERTTDKGFTLGPIPTPPLPTMPEGTARPAAAAAPSAQPQAPAKPEPKVHVEIPRFEPLPANRRETRKPVEGIRKVISEHMVRSVQTSPHVTTFEDVDMTNLVEYRKEIKPWFVETYGANLTYMPFVAKAVCMGLKEFPKVNASMTEKEIVLKNFYNIGIAVAREEGLIVPVIRDCDKKTIVEIAVELQQIGEKARKNQLTPDDVSGGTFSLTNAGMFGATGSTPIINQPQVAILGVHAIVKKPWVVNDEITVRHISNFGMSFDHRLIDGHTAVQFLHRVHEYLADLRKLLLYLR